MDVIQPSAINVYGKETKTWEWAYKWEHLGELRIICGIWSAFLPLVLITQNNGYLLTQAQPTEVTAMMENLLYYQSQKAK